MKRIHILLPLLALLLFVSCSAEGNKNQEATDTSPEEELATSPTNVALPDDLLDGMYPPYDVAKNSSVLDNAIFAWKEMIALSWQSSYNAPGTLTRGEPDPGWTYKNGTPSRPLVWETYAHRIEYRPAGDVITKPFNSAPSYEFATKTGNSIDWNGINPAEQFIVLDEDNEIGSCFVFAEPNITVAAKGDPLLLYMAKVNRVEYDYRKQYFNSKEKLQAGLSKIYIDSTKNHPFVYKNVEKLEEISTYQDASGNDPCGAVHYANEGILVFPCSDEASQTKGVIEIKTAWRPKVSGDDQEGFLSRRAVSFSRQIVGPADTVFRAQLDEYVLLGMHIIHKTNNFRQFFIATWEHNSAETYGYQYALDNKEVSASQVRPVMRHNDSDGAHSRSLETYGVISDAVQAQIRAANPDNFLANYRLTGFQSNLYPELDLATRKTTMPTYFLANLIIESDSLLTYFSGSGFADPYNDGNNITTAGRQITTGGCSGCHGAGAQQKGSDFSFLNDFTGKPIPSPDLRTLTEVAPAANLSSKDYH